MYRNSEGNGFFSFALDVSAISLEIEFGEGESRKKR
jgi:hypothetical protein